MDCLHDVSTLSMQTVGNPGGVAENMLGNHLTIEDTHPEDFLGSSPCRGPEMGRWRVQRSGRPKVSESILCGINP